MGVAKIARRTFLIGAGVAAGGLAVGYYYVRKPYPNPLEETLGPGESTLNPYVKIGADNRITVIVPRAEMGQGVRTTLAALVAEELEVGLEDIHVEHGPASSAYYNAAMLEEGSPFAFFNESFIAESLRSATGPIGKSLGLQATGGSSSLRDGYYRMRKAGCVARMLLVEAAARRWGLDAEGLEIADGRITDPASGSSASYGNLAREAAEVELPKNVRLKPKREWKLLGRSQPKLDIPAKVTGQAEFGIDIELPDMLYGTVKMSPRFGAKAKSADTEAALAVKGVRKVVPIDLPVGSGFGIIADNTWAAFMGAQALEVEWEEASYPRTTEALFAELEKTLDGPADYSLRNDGDVDIAFADAPREEILETEYSVPWLAHACMEPMNATAQWKDGILDIWCGHQSPTLVQWTSAPLVDAESDAVRVHTTYLGGGFGRRIEIDFVQYAVVMAKETGGQPIKVTWTREEDTTHDTYRPASVGRMRARVRKGEVPEAVDISVVGQSPTHGMMGRFFPEIPLVGPDPGLTQGAHDQPYRIANYRVSQTRQELAVPVGIWRSVGNSINGYFHECFMDEIAEAAEIDPLSLRLQLMSDYPAAVGVLQKVADMSGWGRDVALGKGLGLAHVLSFGTWTAQVIEVTNGEDGISIDRVWCVADVGEAMDPENIKAQMMSGIVFGLSAAIGQEITFADGEVQQFNFPDYDAMRMYQCPIIEIEVPQNYHRMGGAGEPGTPPSVPALANAIHAATGKRIRRMPLSSEVKFV